MRFAHLGTVAALAFARDSARAQAPRSWMLGAQAIPVVTRADPTATAGALTEGYVTQPVVMGHAQWRALRGVATLNFEGLTLERGELNTGGYGEGYVDRRHPHTYVHELLAGAAASRGALRASFFAGRGFAPFGSDDPMMRPFEKYPINHHLSQILERVVTVAVIRYGSVIGEGALFNGDEPLSASAAPNWDRLADSWSARLTVLPIDGAEVSGSVAHVESPEVHLGRGLDSRKESVVARFSRATSNSWRYFLAEWARTDERDRGASATVLSSLLAEGAYCRADIVASARIERTDRRRKNASAIRFAHRVRRSISRASASRGGRRSRFRCRRPRCNLVSSRVARSSKWRVLPYDRAILPGCSTPSSGMAPPGCGCFPRVFVSAPEPCMTEWGDMVSLCPLAGLHTVRSRELARTTWSLMT